MSFFNDSKIQNKVISVGAIKKAVIVSIFGSFYCRNGLVYLSFLLLLDFGIIFIQAA